jgi:predicted nuclease of predicted toxin-antitoxin system
VKLWLDAQLPPSLARELATRFDLEVVHVQDLGLTAAKDEAIFASARVADVVLLTKDGDFPRILARHGPPPRVLWLTVGNAGNRELADIVVRNWPRARQHFESGEALVEIRRPA